MPLLDHFRPPVTDTIDWHTFHAVWAGSIADALTQTVPREFQVREHLKLGGGLEIDVATVRRQPGSNGAAGAPHSAWQPPRAITAPATFPDRFEVLVFRQSGGRHLVAAIELVSPGNKDRDDTRSAFAAKVASYLHEGVSVLVIDVVTERRANLHDEIVRLMRMPDDLRMPPDPPLYAVSYRPVLRENRPEIDVWANAFNVGDPLPTMPLRLIADYFVPVELEMSYTAACHRRLIA
jgi:hypothetical protein